MSRFLRLAGIVFLALLAFFALAPSPFSKGRFATFGLLHAALHAALFFVSFHLIAAGARRSGGLALLLLAFGAALEFLQTRRYAIWLEYRDIFADAAGILLAYITRSIWIMDACPPTDLNSRRP